MLQLKKITKDYIIGKPKDRNFQVTNALKGISVTFRKNEFVSILGSSGCGKTTLLNIIGGLDTYTSGDLIINGVSTKQYKDKDWDNYRNNRIGFVFQSYNLINHQTVLENVELALTLSGVKKAERKRRAISALEKVGLKDKINSKPNQLSGGQMQRVAIARALVNDPEIILADEPTGALDTKTSVQVMDLLKEVAKERLVIMVTHNPEIANAYSTRIIKMLDGLMIDDSNEYTKEQINADLVKQKAIEKKLQKDAQKEAAAIEEAKRKKEKIEPIRTKKVKKSMSFFTALSLSFKNLLTKKARTMLVAFAGSIGIIGIALVLSLSSGFQSYINRVQKDTLSKYPITISSNSTDYTKLMETMMPSGSQDVDPDYAYSNDSLSNMLSIMMSGTTKNDLESFKKYLEKEETQNKLKDNATIKYVYNLALNIFYDKAEGISNNKSLLVSPFNLLSNYTDNAAASSVVSDVFEELIDNQELLESQYSLVKGKWADNKVYIDDNGNTVCDVVIILDKNNSLPDYALFALGLRDRNEIDSILKGNNVNSDFKMSLDDIMSLEYSLVLNPDMYTYDQSTGLYNNVASSITSNQYYSIDVADTSFVSENTEVKFRVSGIVKPSDNSTATAMSGAVCYPKALTDYVINKLDNYANDTTIEHNIIADQLATPNTSVITGKIFEINAEYIYSYYTNPANQEEYNNLSKDEQLLLTQYNILTGSNKEAIAGLVVKAFYNNFSSQLDGGSLADVLTAVGSVNLDTPSSISFYAFNFDSKNVIEGVINDYNNMVMADPTKGEDYVISYTDYVGLMMSSVSVIISAISYVLIAFVSISLIVSSIMIGIITYISVLERTKEIGVLRSVGASKRDIKRVFTAESLIIGFIAGMLGIILTLILIIPINIIIHSLAGLSHIAALPWVGAVVLVAISMILTYIAGLLPANIASKKDPVIALRSE